MLIATDKYGQPQIVVLTNKIAAGGESELFLVQNMPDVVAKRFLPKYRTDKKRDKINYLIQHNPNQIGDNDVIWPTHTLWENGQFIGFLMPKAQGEKLELLCAPAPKGKNKTTFLQKYPLFERFLLGEPEAFNLRFKLCYNLLAAVDKLHKTKRYVLVDLKPDNIMIQPNGLVTIIDTDSLQVADDAHFFPANVCTPEYAPVEYHTGKADYTKIALQPTWDYFSLAVVVYKLLLGIHPYAASCKGQYAHCTSVDELIKNGLLPILPAMAQHFHTIPPPHQNFQNLPDFAQNYLRNSLQQADKRLALSDIVQQWRTWILNPAARYTQPKTDWAEWWSGLDDTWQNVFRKNTKANEQHKEFFQKIENLTELNCRYTRVSDLSPLRELKNLASLHCSDTSVSDLSPLRELKNLTKLSCNDAKINDLEPLQELKNLTILSCDNTKISDLSPLWELKNLTYLSCYNTKISDLSPLRELKNLASLHCFDTSVSDLSPLRELKNLTNLSCRDTKISDLSPLRELKNLAKLDCSSTSVSDLSPLRELENLTSLHCGYTSISDLEPLRELKNLTELWCSNTKISDLEPLRELKNLTELWCSNTKISSGWAQIDIFKKEHTNCKVYWP